MKKAEENNSKIIGDLLNETTREEVEKIENRMLLAAKIDDAVKAKNWKKTDLAKALDKEPSVITKWLSGTHNFTADTLWDIQRVLGVTLINLDQKPKEQSIIQKYVGTTQNSDQPCSYLEQIFSEKNLETLVKSSNFFLSNKNQNIDYRA